MAIIRVISKSDFTTHTSQILKDFHLTGLFFEKKNHVHSYTIKIFWFSGDVHRARKSYTTQRKTVEATKTEL